MIYENKVNSAIENRNRAFDIYTMKTRAKYSRDYCDDMYKNSNSTLYVKRIQDTNQEAEFAMKMTNLLELKEAQMLRELQETYNREK